MQRKPVALAFVAVLAMALVPLWRCRLLGRPAAAGNERRQALHIAIVVIARCLAGLMPSVALLLFAREVRLLALREELRIARQVGLWVAGAERRLFAASGAL